MSNKPEGTLSGLYSWGLHSEVISSIIHLEVCFERLLRLTGLAGDVAVCKTQSLPLEIKV